MVNRWEHRQGAEATSQRGENGRQSSSVSGLEDPLEILERIQRATEKFAELAVTQHKRSIVLTTMHTSSVTAAGTVFKDLHLPEEAAIAGAHIENHTLATLTVYEGSGSGGRVVGIVRPSHYKRIALADYISSISIVADIPDPSSALVFVTLSTRQWSPVDTSLS